MTDWLDPDWIFDPAAGSFHWRRERQGRPPIDLEIVRVRRRAWELFKHHHYLNTGIHKAAKCFVARIDGRPAAFASWVNFPHPTHPAWREHRTVCLPDFQGVGIGNALSEFTAAVMRATGRRAISTTSNPAMIGHRNRSPLWRMHRRPSSVSGSTSGGGKDRELAARRQRGEAFTYGRLTAGFEFVGEARPRDARGLGIC